MPARPWILVLDLGSSSVRAHLYDADGVGLDPGPDAQCHYRWTETPPGAMQTDADSLFERVVQVLDGAVAHLRQGGLRVEAVAVASFWHSVLGADAQGAPCTPVYSWGDTRAAAVARRLARELDEADYHRRTGCFLHPSYPLVKLCWLREQRPEAFGRADWWGSFAEYAERRLFGRCRCSHSMASGTGLLDVHRLAWDAAALERGGLDAARLSPLADAGDALRGLREPFAGRWPELAEVPWFPALGDGACANVGSGAVGAGRVGVTVGTTAAARTVRRVDESGFRVPGRLWCYRLDAQHVVLGGALSNGGNGIAELRGALQLPPEREWEAEIAAMQPDSHGLTVLPFLVGERGPGWLHETSASVVGLTAGTPTVYLLRAWMEAVAFRIGAIARRIQRGGVQPEQVHASGGALHASPVWARILADVLDRPVVLSREREETSRGAALVAMQRLGWIDQIAAMPPARAEIIPPDADRHARYRAAMRRQTRLQRALRRWNGANTPSPAPRASEP